MKKITPIDPDNKLIDTIIKCIKCDPKLYEKYYTPNKIRKYDLREFLSIIIDILRLGIPWRKVDKLANKGAIHWSTIYKTYVKLLKDNVIGQCLSKTIRMYLHRKPATKLKIRMTDTTTITNKLGEENVGRNVHYKGKKITKVSMIADKYGIPLDANIYPGNTYDSAIYLKQLDDKPLVDEKLEVKHRQILLADKGYDSSKVRNKLIAKGFIPIIPYNKRNTKNKQKIKHLTQEQKIVYKRRILIEQTFMRLKRNRRIDIRYDRKTITYKGFVMLGILDIILKSI